MTHDHETSNVQVAMFAFSTSNHHPPGRCFLPYWLLATSLLRNRYNKTRLFLSAVHFLGSKDKMPRTYVNALDSHSSAKRASRTCSQQSTQLPNAQQAIELVKLSLYPVFYPTTLYLRHLSSLNDLFFSRAGGPSHLDASFPGSCLRRAINHGMLSLHRMRAYIRSSLNPVLLFRITALSGSQPSSGIMWPTPPSARRRTPTPTVRRATGTLLLIRRDRRIFAIHSKTRASCDCQSTGGGISYLQIQ